MPRALNILEFIEHPQLLNDRSLSEWQRTILKSIYGLPLDEQELDIYKRGTGQQIYVGEEQEEVTLIAGRRSGKTSKIAAAIAVYEAFRIHNLPAGEQASVLLVAPQLKQARIAFRYIRNYVMNSPVVSKSVLSSTSNEIGLDNGITICCYPCSYVAVRGITIVAAICDEMAFWRREETSANPEQEILDAMHPGMATVLRAKLIKISTPFRKEGILWSEFQRRSELDFPVWRAPTPDMNPTISSKILEKAQRRDEQKFRREFLAEFCENVTSWIDSETLQACVVRNRRELPPSVSGTYVAVIDPAFKHDDFALAILQRLRDGTIALCRMTWWRGTKKAPLDFNSVCQQIKNHVTEYGLDRVIGDQHYTVVIQQQLDKLGLFYEEFTFGANTRAQIFSNLRHLLTQRKIELLDSPELLSELGSLEQEATSRGQIDIRPRGQMRDDLAVVVALGAHELSQQTLGSIGPELGIVERLSFSFNPFACPNGAICGKFPYCQDARHCLGFTDIRKLMEDWESAVRARRAVAGAR